MTLLHATDDDASFVGDTTGAVFQFDDGSIPAMSRRSVLKINANCNGESHQGSF
jgi:hypothetical protein